MRPPESFLGQPIRSLQTMLRVIAENDPGLDSIVPDGIYGPETVRIISAFQRRHGLPVTGVTDLATWEAVAAVYELALIEQDQAQTLELPLDPGQVIRKGEQHPHLYVVQSMLKVLHGAYGSIADVTVTGLLDEETEEALFLFQQLSALPATGRLDKHTWKQLALQYPLAASRQSSEIMSGI